MFGPNKRTRDGLQCWCKACRSQAQGSYYERNKERCLIQQKTYRETNAPAIATTQKIYYELNKRKVLIRQAIYYKANRAQVLKKDKAYRERNPSKINAAKRLWERRNKEAVLQSKSRHKKKSAALLTDAYVKGLIANGSMMESKNVPYSLVELKREQMNLRRLAKTLKKAINESSSNTN